MTPGILVAGTDTGVGEPVVSGAVVTGDGLRNPGTLAPAATHFAGPVLLTALGLAP